MTYQASINHSFDVKLAIRLGNLHLAILCEYFIKEIKNSKDTWIPIKLNQLSAEFPFWSSHKVRRLLQALKKNNIIKSKTEITPYGVCNYYAFVNECEFVKGV